MRRVIRYGRKTIVQHDNMTQAGEWKDEDEAIRMYELFVGVAVNSQAQEDETRRQRS